MSGWSTITINVTDFREPEALADELEEDVLGDSDYIAVTDDYVAVCRWGYDTQTDLPNWLVERTEWWTRAVVVNANDTSDSGVGHLYKSKKDNAVHVETKQGYEGAVARDVVGYFRDEYDFDARVRV